MCGGRDDGDGHRDGLSGGLVINIGQGVEYRQPWQGVLEINLFPLHNFLEELNQKFCTVAWETASGWSSLSFFLVDSDKSMILSLSGNPSTL